MSWKGTIMPSAQAILERNTDSEVFMDALPALHRAARTSQDFKRTFLETVQYWVCDKELMLQVFRPHSAFILALLKKAQEMQQNDQEAKALDVIVMNWQHFSPTGYLHGGM